MSVSDEATTDSREQQSAGASHAWWLLTALTLTAAAYIWVYRPFGSGLIPSVQRRFLAYPLIFAVYFLAVWLVWQARRSRRNQRAGVVIVILGAALLRVIVLCGTVPENPDLGRHLWEGLVLLQGHNPYAAPPADERYDYLRERLASQDDDLYSGFWLKHAAVRSVYGPVATGLFTLPHLTRVDRVLALRVMMTCFDMATVLLLVSLAGALRQSPALVVVYAWSPVCINGFADRGQIDAAMVLFVVLSVLLLVRRRTGLAGVAFALAILTKMSPLLLLIPLLRVGRWRFGLAFALTVAICIAPFAGAGLDGLQGFSTFARRWQGNDSVYSLTVLAMTPLRRLLDTGGLVRTLMALAALAYAIMRSRRAEQLRGLELLETLAAISAATILLSPTTFPWYATTMIAFLCFRPRASLLALGAAPMVWYLRFLDVPPDSAWHVVQVAGERWNEPWRIPAYAVVAALLVWEMITSKLTRGADE